MQKNIKVLVVDDSSFFRNIIKNILCEEKGIEVIGTASNGIKAMEFIKRKTPDVVTLDLEMPELNGLETLEEIQKFNKGRPVSQSSIGVIMVSAFTKKGSEITINALEGGAFDFITKGDDSKSSDENNESLKRQLLIKIRTLCIKSRMLNQGVVLPSVSTPQRKKSAVIKGQYKAVLIGTSTGGPKALMEVIPALCELTNLPLFIVQHMPPTFTKSLANSLNKKCKHTVIESEGGEVAKESFAYVAPGGSHLLLKKNKQGEVMTFLNQQAPENGCRPSVDVLFRSGVSAYDAPLISIVLTGMGTDGAKSLGSLNRSGAYIIAQDEASSVVWGMPGSAVASGYVDKVVPLDKIAEIVGGIL